MQPFTPHLSEEMWKFLNLPGLAINQKWPKSTVSRQSKACKVAIQINGKTKNIIDFNLGETRKKVMLEALNNIKIKKMIGNKKAKRIIFVPNRVLNIVL